MTLAFCRIYKTVIEQGNYIKTAAILNMSPSAISHAVTEAEDQLGFKIFNRTKNGITLTECGSTIYPFVMNLLNSEEALNQSIDQINGLEVGTVKLGIFNSICTNWMPQIIESFEQRYPKIQLHLYEGGYEDVIYWIKSGIVDLGFLSQSCTTELPVEGLYRDPLVCIVPPDFPTKNPGYVTIDEIKDQKFVIQREGSDVDVQLLFKRHGLHFHANYQILDDTSVMAMIACGRGISIMPALTAKGLEGDLKTLRITPEECRVIGISMPDKKMLSPAGKALYQHILDYVGKLERYVP